MWLPGFVGFICEKRDWEAFKVKKRNIPYDELRVLAQHERIENGEACLPGRCHAARFGACHSPQMRRCAFLFICVIVWCGRRQSVPCQPVPAAAFGTKFSTLDRLGANGRVT